MPIAARTAPPHAVRVTNDRIALGLLADRGPLTAGQLKDATGLSRPSVSDLVERLRRRGLVRVVGEAGADRRGPNARLYGLVADRAHVAALDVRLAGVTVALADLAGRTVAEAAVPLAARPRATSPGGAAGEEAVDPQDADRAVTAVLRALDRARAAAAATTLHTAVIGAPGLVDPRTGALDRTSATLPLWHGRLAGELRRHLGEDTSVYLENEVNLAGLAEYRTGAASDRETFVLLWLGNGTGAALVLDGALRRGASGGAGEIGFLPVPGTGGLPDSADCAQGFDALASSPAVCALARSHGLPVGPATDAAAAEAVVAAAVGAAGPAEEAFVADLAGRVAIGAAAVTAVLDPGCVVLGGETGRVGGERLAAAVAARLREISPLRTEVRAGAEGGGAVLGGALLVGLDAAREALFA